MKSVIYKVAIEHPDEKVSLLLPDHTEFLSVQNQYEKLALWYRCFPDYVKREYFLRCFVTGLSLPDDLKARFLGTIQFAGGNFVVHCYVEGENGK